MDDQKERGDDPVRRSLTLWNFPGPDLWYLCFLRFGKLTAKE
jgi:hypothetical protein